MNNKSKWNLENMNQYCKANAIGYKILEIKWVQKSYQNQLWTLVKCPNENHKEYWVSWNKFYSANRRCKSCHYEESNKIMWDKDKVINFYNNYSLVIFDINEWHNVDKSIKCINKDGFIVFASITNLKKGNKPSLFQYNKFAIENIQHYCVMFRQEYKLLSKYYIDIKTDYEWEYIGEHLPSNIDRKFTMDADSFINGNCRHPHLSKSEAEIKIYNWLKYNNYYFKDEHAFKDCKNKNPLIYDFYLPNYNLLIEYQGMQHYKPIEFFGGEKTYKKQIKNDQIKRDYCKNKNIILLEIPYWDFNNIEVILAKILRKITDKDLKIC